MTKRKMTKRQILNELLAHAERQEKLNQSYKRLRTRLDNAQQKRNELADNLKEILIAEAKKNKVENFSEYDCEDPIVFKNHVFELDVNVGYSNRTEIDITPAKSVK